jgi:hypothetical protein
MLGCSLRGDQMLHLIQAVSNQASPFEWISQHIQLIGWPALVVCAWQVARFFEKISNQASKTIGQIDTLATNHFPHMEASLLNQDRLMHSMDKSLRKLSGREVEDSQEG